MNAPLEIVPATQNDIPDLVKVYSDAAAHKAAQGDYLWGDQPYTAQEIENLLAGGGVHKILLDGKIVGSVKLTDADERMWGPERGTDGSATYVHQLATSDETRGQNIGESVLDWVVERAAKEGRKAVRLDCSYTNPRLCSYYERRGFAEVERRDIPRRSGARDLRDPVYKAALFERRVA